MPLFFRFIVKAALVFFGVGQFIIQKEVDCQMSFCDSMNTSQDDPIAMLSGEPQHPLTIGVIERTST